MAFSLVEPQPRQCWTGQAQFQLLHDIPNGASAGPRRGSGSQYEVCSCQIIWAAGIWQAKPLGMQPWVRRSEKEELCALGRHSHGRNGLVLSVGMCAQPGTIEAEAGAGFPGRNCLGPVGIKQKTQKPFHANNPFCLVKGNLLNQVNLGKPPTSLCHLLHKVVGKIIGINMCKVQR